MTQPVPTPTPRPTFEVTLGELAASEPALQRLTARGLPMRLAYDLKKLTEFVRAETKTFHELRGELFDKYGENRPPTDAERDLTIGLAEVRAIKPEHKQTYQTAIDELCARIVTIPCRRFDLNAVPLEEEVGCRKCGTLATRPFTIASEDLLGLDPITTEYVPADSSI